MSLDSILCQEGSDGIEILIVDNCSTDSSREIAAQYAQKYPNVRCVKNETNIGPDRNFLKCLEIAGAKYVLLLGDDVLMDGILQKLLKVIAGEPDFIFLNYSPLLSTDPVKAGRTYIDFKGRTGPYVPASIDEFFAVAGARMTFLSSLVFKKERFDAIPHEVRESYINTFFLQTHLALLTMKGSTNSVILTDNCVSSGPNYGCGYDFYDVWFNQYHKLIFDTASQIGVSERVSEELWKDKNSTIRAIFYFRWKVKASKNWDKSCISRYMDKYPWAKFRALVAAYWPRFLLPVVMFIRLVYRKVKRMLRK